MLVTVAPVCEVASHLHNHDQQLPTNSPRPARFHPSPPTPTISHTTPIFPPHPPPPPHLTYPPPPPVHSLTLHTNTLFKAALNSIHDHYQRSPCTYIAPPHHHPALITSITTTTSVCLASPSSLLPSLHPTTTQPSSQSSQTEINYNSLFCNAAG